MYPNYYGTGGAAYGYPVYMGSAPETRAEFIRKFVSQHYCTNFDVKTLIEDATRLYDESIKVVK